MRAVAAHLRLSKMTVSRALRNVAGVSIRTRQRVLEAARQLNYRPDPSLAVLSHYRHGKKASAMEEKIAYVTNFSEPDDWKKNVTFARMFEGVQRRAQNFGYEVEPFWLAAPGLTPRRASQILFQRGIRGIVIGPLAQGLSTLTLDWSRFCAVALGRTLAAPGVTAIATNHVQAVELAWREVARRGYERIGLAVMAQRRFQFERSVLGAWLAADLVNRALGNAREVDVLTGKRDLLSARIAQEVADQAVEPTGCGLDALDIGGARRFVAWGQRHASSGANASFAMGLSASKQPDSQPWRPRENAPAEGFTTPAATGAGMRAFCASSYRTLRARRQAADSGRCSRAVAASSPRTTSREQEPVN